MRPRFMSVMKLTSGASMFVPFEERLQSSQAWGSLHKEAMSSGTAQGFSRTDISINLQADHANLKERSQLIIFVPPTSTSIQHLWIFDGFCGCQDIRSDL